MQKVANPYESATQDFFVNDFGLPLTIKPNFEDKSCDFYFGLTPPPIEVGVVQVECS
jgi:hypothetical protein